MNVLKESKLIKQLTKKTNFNRTIFFIVFDIMLISFSGYASFWLRFNGEIPFSYRSSIFYFILLSLGVKIFFITLYDLNKISWRYVSLTELIKILKALSFSFLTVGLSLFLLKTYIPFEGFPRSILLIDFVLSLIFIGLFRISRRTYFNIIRQNDVNLNGNSDIKKKRVLIVGAGNTGEKIVREMLGNRESEYSPVGIIDDDPSTQGIKIHGIKVLGRKEDIPEVVKDNDIEEVLIAAPEAPSREIKKIVEIVRNSEGVKNIKVIPSIVDLMNGEVTLSDIQEVSLDDLLGRDPVQIDVDIIGEFLRDKVILVTGAGGSIGEELSRTILNFHPNRLIALDNDDTYIFRLFSEAESFKGKVVPIIADIRDKIKIEEIFDSYRPHIVFHSAAYKHVPVLEHFPDEAVKTNILGTRIVAECSLKHKVEKFINISTDKAVNPISIMGATKLATEEMVKAFNSKNKTKFITVRFGNVLGSRGSVVPIFEKMIKKGGPVAVTHPDMKRYFMSISESVLLVLEASALGEGGKIFVLDMGKPIKIIDLAREMIRLSGFRPDVDIPIIFSKKRPGEKIEEELWADYEEVEETKHKKILKIRSDNQRNIEKLFRDIDLMIELSNKSNSNSEIIKLLEEMFPSFKYAEGNL